ncbi:MAG TPA: class B sortase [Candidatus Egerieenecus merdigallinarum]|nr:class B sortase [Candidatus Egerieenecus merdigallinarum]
MSPRFAKLKQQNQDIVAWLTIPEQLDIAVVQRDNTYYLNRDYLGYHNDNGAIFLDMGCDLTGNPKALILYGHNMKTGAMFGNLRKYETYSYFRTHPIITCDTQYEEGDFLVFAALRVNTVYGSTRFVNYTMYNQMTSAQQEETLAALLRLNAFPAPVDVNTGDQLLILSTCTGDDRERLLVCARRVRPGESTDAPTQ